MKEKNKYRNWYSGLSTILMETEGTPVKFNPVTLAESGEVETPFFREDFDRQKFIKTLEYSLTLEAPPLENVNIVINVDFDIHEFDDSVVIVAIADDEVLFNSKDVKYRTHSQNIKQEYPIKGTKETFLIKYSRNMTRETYLTWNGKRNTGMKVWWFYNQNIPSPTGSTSIIENNKYFIQLGSYITKYHFMK